MKRPDILVRLYWRDNVTGQTGTYDTSEPACPHGDDCCDLPEMFMWEEGNYSCDCNRGVKFLGWHPRHDIPVQHDAVRHPQVRDPVWFARRRGG